jgi:hypothetical protein
MINFYPLSWERETGWGETKKREKGQDMEFLKDGS